MVRFAHRKIPSVNIFSFLVFSGKKVYDSLAIQQAIIMATTRPSEKINGWITYRALPDFKNLRVVNRSALSAIDKKQDTPWTALANFFVLSSLAMSKRTKVIVARVGPKSIVNTNEHNNIALMRALCSVGIADMFVLWPSMTHSAVFSLGSCIPGLTARSWSFQNNKVLCKCLHRCWFLWMEESQRNSRP